MPERRHTRSYAGRVPDATPSQSALLQQLSALAGLPGVTEAADAAREAGTQLGEQGSAWREQGARADLDTGASIARQGVDA